MIEQKGLSLKKFGKIILFSIACFFSEFSFDERLERGLKLIDVFHQFHFPRYIVFFRFVKLNQPSQRQNCPYDRLDPSDPRRSHVTRFNVPHRSVAENTARLFISIKAL